ncbi:MAG: GNAT family N-acetyltransferase, partial [Nitratireductor sp.]|nr:GNAT family N-acetyltransferase [Nitratireductor sp.]
DGDTADLKALFVDPQFIGKGIGGALWRDVLENVENAGVARLLCQSDPNAESFYLKMGMTRIGETPSGSIPGRMLPLLEIKLR